MFSTVASPPIAYGMTSAFFLSAAMIPQPPATERGAIDAFSDRGCGQIGCALPTAG
jgi:hypothetical protein